MKTATPFVRPTYVQCKPVGSHCNLACKYCYYLEKKCLYKEDVSHVMSDEILEIFISQYIAMQPQNEVLFTWHGGEPLMRPIQFYEKALALQQKYAAGKYIDNAIQTNATLITEDWARFFRKYNFLVGVSIDGPRDVHDNFRKTKMGTPTHHQVMQAIALLNKYGVEWNALAVVNNENAQDPIAFYDFFKSINCRFLQFTPVVERILFHTDGRKLAEPLANDTAQIASFSVTPKAWGNFLCSLFDLWVANDVGQVFVQLFDATLAAWVGVMPGLCTMAKYCGHAGAIEYNGDVYACDHFVFPEYKLGNIKQTPLKSLLWSDVQLRFGADKFNSLTPQCKNCEWLFVCNGECPRTRFAFDCNNNPGHPYLCEGYSHYFTHVAPYMDFMKRQLLNGGEASAVMQWIKDGKP